MKILYFARLRQIIGRGSDEVEVPPSVSTVSELMDFLSLRDDGLAAVFADRRTIKAAVDQTHAQFDAAITGAREVAFFPPVTGG